MLDKFRGQSLITAKSKWKDFYPMFSREESYNKMLGQQGSTPIELFFDIIEDHNDFLYQKRKSIEKYLIVNLIFFNI